MEIDELFPCCFNVPISEFLWRIDAFLQVYFKEASCLLPLACLIRSSTWLQTHRQIKSRTQLPGQIWRQKGQTRVWMKAVCITRNGLAWFKNPPDFRRAKKETTTLHADRKWSKLIRCCWFFLDRATSGHSFWGILDRSHWKADGETSCAPLRCFFFTTSNIWTLFLLPFLP